VVSLMNRPQHLPEESLVNQQELLRWSRLWRSIGPVQGAMMTAEPSRKHHKTSQGNNLSAWECLHLAPGVRIRLPTHNRRFQMFGNNDGMPKAMVSSKTANESVSLTEMIEIGPDEEEISVLMGYNLGN